MSKIIKETEIKLKEIIEKAVACAIENGELPQAEMPDFIIEIPAN